MPVQRCAHCGHVLSTQTLPQAIEARIEGGPSTMEQIKATGRAFDPNVTDRQIYNALGMLARYGRIRRVGYGHYEAMSA